MGLTITRLAIEEYGKDTNIYQKRITGKHDFDLEAHHLDGGKKLQLYFYRAHPRMKEFIERSDEHGMVTKQTSNITGDFAQGKMYIGDEAFMFLMTNNTQIKITEYNIKQDLADCKKGKIGVLIDFTFEREVDNNKLVTDLKAFFKQGEQNEG